MKPLKPFLSFYGSKYRAAKLYPPPLPAHHYVVEPFAGAAGYSLHYHWLNIILFDIDPVVAGIWDYLIKVPEHELLSIPTDIEHVNNLPSYIPQEAKWLIGFWLTKAGAHPRLSSRSTWNQDAYPSSYFWEEKTKIRIASQLGSIRHWKIHNRSYCDCLPHQPATYFVDPPYQGRPGSHYVYGSRQIDYADLAQWCLTRPEDDQVIVCEQEGTWLPFQPLARIKALKRKYTQESIWIRRPK